eukprot:7498121-Karenia_brevis.AAC.1
MFVAFGILAEYALLLHAMRLSRRWTTGVSCTTLTQCLIEHPARFAGQINGRISQTPSILTSPMRGSCASSRRTRLRAVPQSIDPSFTT